MLEKNKIYNGDCLEIMKSIGDKSIDIVLTDPPYGIGVDGQKLSFAKNPKHNRKEHTKKDWDSSPPTKEYFDEIFRISKKQIIFGANYFNEYLEQGHKGWIIWDKGQRDLTMSDCEIIYTSFGIPTRIITINRVELLKDHTTHPTQKPLKLVSLILRDYTNESDLILDCFSGSGTTAIACINTNRNYICIEKDKTYFDKSVERVEKHLEQTNMFRKVI